MNHRIVAENTESTVVAEYHAAYRAEKRISPRRI